MSNRERIAIVAVALLLVALSVFWHFRGTGAGAPDAPAFAEGKTPVTGLVDHRVIDQWHKTPDDVRESYCQEWVDQPDELIVTLDAARQAILFANRNQTPDVAAQAADAYINDLTMVWQSRC